MYVFSTHPHVVEGRTECVRLKNFVVEAKIQDNNIRHCGMYDFAFGEGGFNGEGIYIGTSSSQVGRQRCIAGIVERGGGRGRHTV